MSDIGICPAQGKVQHATPQAAWRALELLKRQPRRRGVRKGGHAYKCPFCGLWHITSMERGEAEEHTRRHEQGSAAYGDQVQTPERLRFG